MNSRMLPETSICVIPVGSTLRPVSSSAFMPWRPRRVSSNVAVALCVSHDGKKIAYCTRDELVIVEKQYVKDVEPYKVLLRKQEPWRSLNYLREPSPRQMAVTSACFTSEDTVLVVCLKSGDIVAAANLDQFEGAPVRYTLIGSTESECLSMDSCYKTNVVVSGHVDGAIYILYFKPPERSRRDSVIMERMARFRVSGRGISSVSLNEEGTRAAVCSNWNEARDFAIPILSQNMPDETETFRGICPLSEWTWACLLSKDGSKAVTGCEEYKGKLTLWDIPAQGPSTIIVQSNAASMNFETFVTCIEHGISVLGAENGQLLLWDMFKSPSEDFALIWAFDQHAVVKSMAMARGGRCVCALDNGTVVVLDLFGAEREALVAFVHSRKNVLPVDVLRTVKSMLIHTAR